MFQQIQVSVEVGLPAVVAERHEEPQPHPKTIAVPIAKSVQVFSTP